MAEVELPVVRLAEGGQLPAYTRVGDAGLDLRCAEDFSLAPFERKAVPCGIAIQIPEGYGGFVLPRSGLALNHGLSMPNAPGLIDSNYRGELKVLLVNLDPKETFQAKAGERIAQLVIAPVASVNTVLVSHLEESNRGEAGFGSSGRD